MLGDLIAFLVVGGGLALLAWTAFVGQYRPHPSGYVCRQCGAWLPDEGGCASCTRLRHPTARRLDVE